MRIIHQIAKASLNRSAIRFKRATHRIEAVQREKLHELLSLAGKRQPHSKLNPQSIVPYELWRDQAPITTYDDWRDLVDEQKSTGNHIVSGEPCARYQPTSGSSSRIKWIPYTKRFLWELDQAISPWMNGIYDSFPKTRQGQHYWSLSWIPTELRQKVDDNVNNDLEILPWWKRIFAQKMMAVPDSIAYANTSDESMFATLCYLSGNKNLSIMSIWSPTFLLSLVRELSNNRQLVATVLKEGQWGDFAQGLQKTKCPKSSRAAQILASWDGVIEEQFLRELWPNLALISSWDTASAKVWASELREIFPHVGWQAKGLWATEGAVTFALGDQFPLAINSHFYEFKDLETGDILPSWEIRKNGVYQPILSTESGLMRYQLADQVKVDGFLGTCPTLTFLGRLDGTDLVGEKIAASRAQEILTSLNKGFPIRAVTLIATKVASTGQKPYYALLAKGSITPDEEARLAQEVEAKLQEDFHYKLARDLKQLRPAQVHVTPQAYEVYQERLVAKGMVVGNMKVEPLVQWSD